MMHIEWMHGSTQIFKKGLEFSYIYLGGVGNILRVGVGWGGVRWGARLIKTLLSKKIWLWLYLT